MLIEASMHPNECDPGHGGVQHELLENSSRKIRMLIG